jgi:hypothetical protein
MAAFAVKLPATIGEQQMACILRCGGEHCEEFRVNTNDPAVTIFAGVLRNRFATKKSAQTAFGLNLKTWGIDRDNKSARGWYRELTVEEYLSEFRDVPGTTGRRMHGLVWGILNKCNGIALQHVARALAEKEKKEAERLEQKRAVLKRIREGELDCYAKGFKALRTNAGGVSRRAAEAMRQKILHLRGHLELLSQVRTEHPDATFYLSDDWEKRTHQDQMDRVTKRGFKGGIGATFYRKHEERREAEILRGLEFIGGTD